MTIDDDGFDDEYKDEAYNDVWGTRNPNFNKDNKPSFIELKQSPEVQKSELIKVGYYYPDRNRAKISLNGKVNADIIFTPDAENWQRNIKMVMDQAEAYGYTGKEYRSTFYRFLNDNEFILSYNSVMGNKDKNNASSNDAPTGGTGGTGGISGNNTAEAIVNIVMKNGKLFHNEFEQPHALLVIDNHYETLSIDGRKFEHYLAKLYYDNNEKKVANAEAINNAIRILASKAIFEGETIPLHLKVAWSNPEPEKRDSIYYDLTDKKRRCVKIVKGMGWHIVDGDQTEVLFKRFGHQSPQFEPIRDYDPDVFDTFINSLNIKNPKHKLLVKVWIISLLIPEIAHPILLPYGEKGGAKSTLLRKIQIVIAPTTLDLLSVPYRKEEFIQQLSHNFLCFYDNVRIEPPWLSDEACRATTGGGFLKRMLYSDDEDIPYRYKKIQGYTGINVLFTEPDALDRGLKTELERIDDKVTIPDTKIDDELREQVPQLLGYIFDKLSKVLEIKDSVMLDRLPRMADFGVWGETISRALGHEPLEFLNAYFENIGEQNIEIVEANPFAKAIANFIDYQNRSWISFPDDFLAAFKAYTEANDIDNRKFPKNATTLSRRLNKIKSNLREGLGIEVKVERITGGIGNKKFMNRTLIKIRTIAPVPPVPPVGENDEGNKGKSAGGITIWYWCNYCPDVFSTGDSHTEHCKMNHEGLPPRPHRRDIERLKGEGLHQVDAKGNAWE